MKSTEDQELTVIDCLDSMDISSSDPVQIDPDAVAIKLDSLPNEVLLHILDYLDVKFIVDVLSRVNLKFKQFAENDATWRIRIHRRWPGQYPAIPLACDTVDSLTIHKKENENLTNQNAENSLTDNQNQAVRKFSWTEACINREESTRVWSDPDLYTSQVTCSNAHYSSVDCVKVLGDLIVSGSRDRGINIWNVDDVKKGISKPCFKLPDAHKGWVWSFSSNHDSNRSTSSIGDTLVSGSWDNTVKFWSITPSALRETRKPVNLRVAVLDTDMLGHTLVAATYDKRVVIMDEREEVKKMTFYRSHSKPVLGVKVTPRHIMSLSEDQTLVVYDRVAGKRYKRLTIPGSGFPLSLSLCWNSLYVGDKSGGIHLVDTSQDRFDVVQSYRTGGKSKITSIIAGLGCVVSSSSDGDIRIHHPDRNMDLIRRIGNPECGELASVSYNDTPGNQTLVAGFSNNTVKIWSRT